MQKRGAFDVTATSHTSTAFASSLRPTKDTKKPTMLLADIRERQTTKVALQSPSTGRRDHKFTRP
jgi:hypothetical protein